MASATSFFPSPSLLHSFASPPPPPPPSYPFSISANWVSVSSSHRYKRKSNRSENLYRNHLFSNSRNPRFICRAAEYKFPDPIPEFAEAETDKFRTHLSNKLSKKDMFGDSVQEVVGICTESDARTSVPTKRSTR